MSVPAHAHGRVVCTKCDAVLKQCRCPAHVAWKVWTLCEPCRPKARWLVAA